MSADVLLSRLEGVRMTGPGRWVARCPSHQDKSPSLSIREIDGRVLLHDFAGCATADVLAAVGLRFGDLFDKPLPGNGPTGGYPRSHSRFPATDALVALDHEIAVAFLILANAIEHRSITEPDMARLAQCAARIGAARDLCCPAEVRHVA